MHHKTHDNTLRAGDRAHAGDYTRIAPSSESVAAVLARFATLGSIPRGSRSRRPEVCTDRLHSR